MKTTEQILQELLRIRDESLLRINDETLDIHTKLSLATMSGLCTRLIIWITQESK